MRTHLIQILTTATVFAVVATAPAQATVLHRWPGDGNANDVVGSANGTLVNGAGFAPALFDQGFSLDGVDDSVSFGTSAGNLGSGDFTIAFAIKTTSTNATEDVVTKRSACQHGSFFEVHTANGTLTLELDQDAGGTNHTSVGSIEAINDGFFHTAVVTRQGQTLTWFIDGQPTGSSSAVPAANVSNSTALVAGDGPCADPTTGDGSKRFNGILDDIRIADTADPSLLPPPAPVNVSAPTIPATGHEGEPATCQPGTWRYHPTFAFAWLRDGLPIPNAVAASYTATAADAGHTLTCRVSASNVGGSATADSNAMAVSAVPLTPSTGAGAGNPPPPSKDVAVAASTPACVSIPAVIRSQVAPVRGGGKVFLGTGQVDNPAGPLKASVRFAGRGSIRSVTFTVNGHAVAGSGHGAALGIGSLRIGSRRNKLVATVALRDGRKVTVTQFFVVLRCPLPPVSCRRLTDGRSLRCSARTPLGARRVKVTVTRSDSQTAKGSAAVTNGRYTVTVHSAVQLPAGKYAYKHVATTRKPGQRFQMIRLVTVA